MELNRLIGFHIPVYLKKVPDSMRRLNLTSALPLIQLKTAASNNDPPFKTLGLKAQNNTMTTSRLNLVIQSARICLQRAQNLQHLKTSEDTGSAGPS